MSEERDRPGQRERGEGAEAEADSPWRARDDAPAWSRQPTSLAPPSVSPGSDEGGGGARELATADPRAWSGGASSPGWGTSSASGPNPGSGWNTPASGPQGAGGAWGTASASGPNPGSGWGPGAAPPGSGAPQGSGSPPGPAWGQPSSGGAAGWGGGYGSQQNPPTPQGHTPPGHGWGGGASWPGHAQQPPQSWGGAGPSHAPQPGWGHAGGSAAPGWAPAQQAPAGWVAPQHQVPAPYNLHAEPGVVHTEQNPGGLAGWFSTRGRLGRLDYFMRGLITAVLGFVPLVTLAVASDGNEAMLLPFGLAMMVGAPVYLWVSIALSVRRLHDLGKPGWYLLASLIPLVSYVLTFYLLFAPGNPSANEYGPPPND